MQPYPQPNQKQPSIHVIVFIGVMLILSGLFGGMKLESLLLHQQSENVLSFATIAPTQKKIVLSHDGYRDCASDAYSEAGQVKGGNGQDQDQALKQTHNSRLNR